MSDSRSESDLFEQIRGLVLAAQNQVRQSVNSAMVFTYWEIGRIIVEDEQAGERRAAYGKEILRDLSDRLTKEFGKGFDITNLRNIRRFYIAFPIRETLSPELAWSHYNRLARVENKNAREWYMKEAAEKNWSVRALQRQISVLYYERLMSSQDIQAVESEAATYTQKMALTPAEYLRDPYVLDFLNLDGKRYLETDIEQGIIDNLQQFLLELGKGFAFVERQQRVRFEDQDFYIDLVFYNFKLKCFLLLDLKLGTLTHQDVGQMDTYVRFYNDNKKGADDNPTIGLVLCSEKSQAVVKYSILSDNEQLFAAKYLPYLPSEDELRKELERDRYLIQQRLTNESKDNE